MTNPGSAEAEETADVPDEEYKEPSIRQIFKLFFFYKKSGQGVFEDSVHTYSMPTELKSRRWELYKSFVVQNRAYQSIGPQINII
jgi:hypothetical protein